MSMSKSKNEKICKEVKELKAKIEQLEADLCEEDGDQILDELCGIFTADTDQVYKKDGIYYVECSYSVSDECKGYINTREFDSLAILVKEHNLDVAISYNSVKGQNVIEIR